MTNEELKKNLETFLETNRPPCCLQASYHIVFRKTKMIAVKSAELQIGDIRILQLEASDFVKGLSPDQWTTLLLKIRTLVNISMTNIF